MPVPVAMARLCITFGDLKRTKRLIHESDKARFNPTFHLFPTQERRPNYKKTGARFSAFLTLGKLSAGTE